MGISVIDFRRRAYCVSENCSRNSACRHHFRQRHDSSGTSCCLPSSGRIGRYSSRDYRRTLLWQYVLEQFPGVKELA